MNTDATGTRLRDRWRQGTGRSFRGQTANVPVGPDDGERRILSGPFAGRSCVVLSVEDGIATVILDVFDGATPVQIGPRELGDGGPTY